jgi:hypothetical protein
LPAAHATVATSSGPLAREQIVELAAQARETAGCHVVPAAGRRRTGLGDRIVVDFGFFVGERLAHRCGL